MTRAALCLALLALAAPARAATLGWRGDGTGVFPEADPPTKWDIDEGTNILWQAKVGKGQSAPVALGTRVFLTAEHELLLCVDARTGKLLWKQDNGYGALPPGTKVPKKRPPASPGCGYSTPTPVTDGSLVYASYGTGIVACCDLDGARKWLRFLDEELLTQYGRSASPRLADGKLLVSVGGLAALDARTGEVLWHAKEAKPTYGTPALARIGEAPVAITPGGDWVRLSDGRILAAETALADYSSPLVDGGVVYFVGQKVLALKLPEAMADKLQPQMLWENDDVEGLLYASPILHQGILYLASNEGNLYALDAKTGKLILKKELEIASAGGEPGRKPANLYPSLTLAGKHLLLGNDAGETLVLAPGRDYRELGHNFLDAGSGASPVPDGRLLFLRGGDRLYCIGPK